MFAGRYRWCFLEMCQSTRFNQTQLPIEWISQDRDSRNYNANAPSVKLITMHSSKGLEFPVVFVPGIGFLPNSKSTPAEEAKLLYVAMTRAIDRLIMTCDRKSEFTIKIRAALDQVKV